MEVRCAAEVLSVEDGVIQIAFDLSASEAGYLIISMPQAGAEAEDDFFGHTHYVELKDQLFGRYGGLSRISVAKPDRLELSLTFEVPNVGSTLAINTSEPMPPFMLAQLQSLRSSE
jgi:hypothetical protein